MGCHQIGTLQSLILCALFPSEAPLFQKNFGARADPLPLAVQGMGVAVPLWQLQLWVTSITR
jgi:hypothetical protein